MVEPLLDKVLGENIEVELLAGDSGFESRRVFEALEARRIAPLVAWRRMKGRKNPSDVLSVRDRIDVEGPEHKRVVYKKLRALVEGFIGRVKSRLGFGRLTWQGLENVGINVCLVLMVVYAVAIAAICLGRPELRRVWLSSREDGRGLGVELKKTRGFSCCHEPVGFLSNDKLAGMAIAARNIPLAEEEGLDIITLCNGCTYSLRHVNHALKADEE
jgi:hypothetical protein